MGWRSGMVPLLAAGRQDACKRSDRQHLRWPAREDLPVSDLEQFLRGLCSSATWRSRRFERACTLLAEPSATVAQVALRLGFSDAANFSRAFRRVFGMAPGEYQKRGESARGT